MRQAHHKWTERENRILRLFYADTLTETVAAILGFTVRSVFNQAYKLGLRKSAWFFASVKSGRTNASPRGQAHRFPKGHAPWNKGMKGLRIGGEATQFKPGHRPHTWKPIGTERTSKEGFLQVKLTDTGYPPRDWVAIHLLVWELHRGPIPPGHAVCFKDGDRTHIAIDNLECIPRRELMARNTVHNLPKPLVELVQLRGALQRKINRRMSAS